MYGKWQSPWNWKTKVPASDKHYWPLSLSRHLCFLLSNFKVQSVTSSFTHHARVTKACVTLHPHVHTLSISYARLLSKLTPSWDDKLSNCNVINSHLVLFFACSCDDFGSCVASHVLLMSACISVSPSDSIEMATGGAIRAYSQCVWSCRPFSLQPPHPLHQGRLNVRLRNSCEHALATSCTSTQTA